MPWVITNPGLKKDKKFIYIIPRGVYKAHGLKSAVEQIEVGAQSTLNANRVEPLYTDGEPLPQIA